MSDTANKSHYRSAMEFLCSLKTFGAKLGLENSFRLAELAGNPQRRLRFIHVAGTNGKGSVCAMLEGIYRATGLRVGLFTSPHLVSFRERIQVNRVLISEAEAVQLVDEMRTLLAQFPVEHHPTFFEVVTVMALRAFAAKKCDLVIWETGLGGRLDATNIVTPLASVITNIGIEHSEWLGDTVDKIASEKAGIIKPGVPVITGARPREGLEPISAAAREKNSPLIVVDRSQAEKPPLDGIQLPLPGPHQRHNAATVLATVRALAGLLPANEDAIRTGLASVHWPGRMQWLQKTLDQIVLLDGAHNPDGAEALRVALKTEFPQAKPTVIFGVFRDKDSRSMCRSLAPLASRILLTPVPSDRTEDPARLVSACQQANALAPIEICTSLAEALKLTDRDPFVVIAGSLYLIGEAMELLHLDATPAADEKHMNDWTPKHRQN